MVALWFTVRYSGFLCFSSHIPARALFLFFLIYAVTIRRRGYKSNDFFSSCVTDLKKGQSIRQLAILRANVPWALPPHSVPVTAQQARPPFLPPLTPSVESSSAATQTPSSATRSPPGSLPHWRNSQQLSFAMLSSLRMGIGDKLSRSKRRLGEGEATKSTLGFGESRRHA